MQEPLKDDTTLANSAVVANNAMNRQRKATGINSYEKELKFNPVAFLTERLDNATINWLDLCCGEGNALIQAAIHFKSKHNAIQLKGIDLVDYFSPHDHTLSQILSLNSQNLSYWNPKTTYDLITCVHGLHYVGDKLGLIQKVAKALKKDGIFMANLDLDNIKIQEVSDTDKWLKRFFKKAKMQYNSNTNIVKLLGPSIIEANLEYVGSNDKIGPNYTGQPAVCSVYTLKDRK